MTALDHARLSVLLDSAKPLPTMMHDVGLPCIHLVATMPRVIVVSRGPVKRLNFQPRITCEPRPVIASRRGNVLILSVDLIGPLGTVHPARTKTRDYRLTHRWFFELVDAGGFFMAVRK